MKFGLDSSNMKSESSRSMSGKSSFESISKEKVGDVDVVGAVLRTGSLSVELFE